MSRGKSPAGATATAAQSADAGAIAAFLRALAQRVERDAALAEAVGAALRESGLLVGAATDATPARGRRRPATGSLAAQTPVSAASATPPDPFALLREGGEARLRAALASLDVETLRAVVRTYRLDPSRIAARWKTADRLITLIVEQARARANHGKAFAQM